METHYCSPLDSVFPTVIQSYILGFSCDTTKTDVISKFLVTGFEKVIQARPYLADQVAREENEKDPNFGRVKFVYNEDDIDGKTSPRIWVNNLIGVWSISYEELRKHGAPISDLKAEILGPPCGHETLKRLPIAAQINFIQGGCLLNICINHSCFDGLGGAEIVGEWAEQCKKLQLNNSPNLEAHPNIYSEVNHVSPLQPLDVPGPLQCTVAPQDAEEILHDASLWQLLGLRKNRPSDHTRNMVFLNTEPNDKLMVSAIFRAPKEKFKATSTSLCTREEAGSSDTAPYITSFDSISALLWRCIMRARSADVIKLHDQTSLTSRLRIPVDLRSTLGIPRSYFGNVLLNSVTDMPLNFLIAPQTTGHQIASEIRLSILRSRDKQQALNAIQLSHTIVATTEASSRRPIFPNTTAECLVLVSWQDLNYYGHDWGSMFGVAGTADFFRVPHGYLPGICALHPRRNDNIVEVLISLEKEQMDVLTKDVEFMRVFELVSM